MHINTTQSGWWSIFLSFMLCSPFIFYFLSSYCLLKLLFSPSELENLHEPITVQCLVKTSGIVPLKKLTYLSAEVDSDNAFPKYRKRLVFLFFLAPSFMLFFGPAFGLNQPSMVSNSNFTFSFCQVLICNFAQQCACHVAS